MKQVCFNMKLSVEREGLVLFCFLKVVAGQYLRYMISLLNQEQIWPSEYMKSSVSHCIFYIPRQRPIFFI